ncbi:MAG: alpha/beta fold hydrolase [Planctomycetes bacterium]|nr:alpha/beta fold hydrolase [Planctomycetota bacterium]
MSVRTVPFLLALLSTAAPAQVDRYELGRRLRAMETAFALHQEAAAKARALPHLERAVRSFFLMRAAEAGKALDHARFALAHAGGPDAAWWWAQTLHAQPARRLQPAGARSLELAIAAFYPLETEPPKDLRAVVELRHPGTREILAWCEWRGGALPGALRMELPALPDEDVDHVLETRVFVGEAVLARGSATVSRVRDPDGRLARLAAALAERRDVRTTEVESARNLLARLKALAGGRTLETDLPAARLLHDAEALLACAREGRPFLGEAGAQHWLRIVDAADVTTVRVQIPREVPAGRKAPLLVAMHGAGGSENLFFDGYGNGAVARLAAERGWFVVAPRGSGFGGASLDPLLDALAARWPISRDEVYLVGHSMGAMQAIGAVRNGTRGVRGVAALGGGGGIARPRTDLARIGFFVAAGSADFALGGARGLADSLERSQTRRTLFRVYDGVEHLTIVQEALPDVFAFFDALRRE